MHFGSQDRMIDPFFNRFDVTTLKVIDIIYLSLTYIANDLSV